MDDQYVTKILLDSDAFENLQQTEDGRMTLRNNLQIFLNNAIWLQDQMKLEQLMTICKTDLNEIDRKRVFSEISKHSIRLNRVVEFKLIMSKLAPFISGFDLSKEIDENGDTFLHYSARYFALAIFSFLWSKIEKETLEMKNEEGSTSFALLARGTLGGNSIQFMKKPVSTSLLSKPKTELPTNNKFAFADPLGKLLGKRAFMEFLKCRPPLPKEIKSLILDSLISQQSQWMNEQFLFHLQLKKQ